MVDYSKWDHLDDGDPQPESAEDMEPVTEDPEPETEGLPQEQTQRPRSAAKSRSAKKGKTSKRNKPRPAAAESAYVPSFAGQAGRFVLMHVVPRYSPALMPEDAARVEHALLHVCGVENAVVDTKKQLVTITGPRGCFAKNPPTAQLLRAVKAAGMPGYEQEVSITLLNDEARRAVAAGRGENDVELLQIDKILQISGFWCWLLVGVAICMRAAGMRHPCGWCLHAAMAVGLREPVCEVFCAHNASMAWGRWNPISAIILGLEVARYVEFLAMIFCKHLSPLTTDY